LRVERSLDKDGRGNAVHVFLVRDADDRHWVQFGILLPRFNGSLKV
jgi:hypothetical protein